MNIRIALFIAFMVQEPISSGVVMLQALQGGVTQLESFLIFLFATVVDILIGYGAGYIIFVRFKETKIGVYIQSWIDKAGDFQESRLKQFFLFLCGTAIFPVSSLCMPWLQISLRKTLAIFVLGEMVFWYSAVWATVTGISFYSENPLTSLILIVFVLLVFKFVMRYLYIKTRKKSSE